MKYRLERNYTHERLYEFERRLIERLPHTLSEGEMEMKRAIVKEEMRRDMFWGFYNTGISAAAKRVIYKIVIHRFLKKYDLPMIKVPLE